MKIPSDAEIAPEKLTRYLLLPQAKNDKSKWLASLGFTLNNPSDLEIAIRNLVKDNEAVLDREDEYGVFYQVQGILRGSNRQASAVSIWIYTQASATYRFITLKPHKE
ncbi:MAG: DUF6883 domain-containing protein [Phototrophicaceae bacterium]